MRVNVYAEEMTSEYEIVTKEAEGNTFIGVRFYLLSPVSLHHTETDDDRSSVTFWTREAFTIKDMQDLFAAVRHSLSLKERLIDYDLPVAITDHSKK